MKEFGNVRQDPEGYKRLFFDEDFDLYVWYDRKGGEITGFQLVYGIRETKKALTWRASTGMTHLEVDGWDNTAYQGSPLLVPDGKFARSLVMPKLEAALVRLEPEIARKVASIIDLWSSRNI